MKLRSHFIWIATLFLLVDIPLFYVLYEWNYIPNKEWNDNSNATKCLVVGNEIVGASCDNEGGRNQAFPRDPLRCFDGIAALRYVNTTRSFDVAYGSYDEVNQTLEKNYRKGSCVGCVVQITNSSDFELHTKPVIGPLTLSIVVPGIITVILIIWVVGALLAKKKPYFEIQYL